MGCASIVLARRQLGSDVGEYFSSLLARLARGLDCDVHYMLIPRTSLVEQVLKRTHEVAGISFPPAPKVTEILREAESLKALSELLAQVNKRGLW